MITLLLIEWHTPLMRMIGMQEEKSCMKLVIQASKEGLQHNRLEEGVECLLQGNMEQQT